MNKTGAEESGSASISASGVSLLKNEKIEMRVKRARIGLALIWLIVIVLSIGAIAGGQILGNEGVSVNFGAGIKMPGLASISWVLVLIFIVGGFVASYVYNGNEMIVTNWRLIQRTMIAPFSESTNVIEMTVIDDVSLRREGLVSHVFKVGTIRISTVSDETTYTFKFADTPQDEVDTILSIIHKAKSYEK